MSRLNPTGAPPETKWVAQTGSGIGTATVLWALLTYVWPNAIQPPQLNTYVITYGPLILGAAAGWLAKHTPRVDEVVAVAVRLIAEQQPAAVPVVPALPPVPPSYGQPGGLGLPCVIGRAVLASGP